MCFIQSNFQDHPFLSISPFYRIHLIIYKTKNNQLII